MNRLLRLLANKKTYQSLLLIICILFVQIGYDLFFSFGTLGFLLLLFYTKKKISRYTSTTIFFFIIINILSLVIYILRYGDEFLFVLRDIRVGIMVCLFIMLLNPQNRLKLHLNFINIVLVCTFSLCVFTIIQFFLSKYHIYYIVPEEYYSVDDGALASKWLKKSIEFGFEFTFRPSAFYSEVSYLGFVCCCFYYFTINQLNTTIVRLTKVLLITTVILSSSALGVGGILLLFLVKNWKKYIVPNLPLFTLVGVIVVIAFSLELNQSRIALILSGNDESALTRFVKPLEIISYNFSNADLLGVPFSSCIKHFMRLRFYGLSDDPPFHNALINLIINYGALGVLLIYVFFVYLIKNMQEKVLLVICMSQSGAFFVYGKVFIFLLFVLIIREQNKKIV